MSVSPNIRHIAQPNQYYCGPATIATILSAYNKRDSISNIAKVCHAKKDLRGTNQEGLLTALYYYKIPHSVKQGRTTKELENAIAHNNWCLVNYQAWGDSGRDYELQRTGHYSIIVSQTKSHFILIDPYLGFKYPNKKKLIRTIRKDLFFKRWFGRDAQGSLVQHWYVSITIA